MNNLERIRNDAIKFESNGIHKEDIKIGDINVRYFEIEPNINKIEWGDFYVPLGYIYTNDKYLMLSCFNKHKDLAFDVVKKFQDDIFSQDCIDYVYRYTAGDLQKTFNIVPDIQFGSDYTLIYAIFDINKLNLSVKQNTTIKFDKNINYDVICTKIDKTTESLFYGTLIDNKIVSIVNLAKRPDDGINIIGGVGTHEDYRNKGYAVSNVVAMAEYILNTGKIIIYGTTKSNIASQKTAMAAGLSEITKIQRFYFKKE
jgi:hypothetical protein